MEQSLEIDGERVQLYFSQLGSRLKEFRRYKKKMDVYLSSDFNVFQFIKPNENRLSDIIADMLDPNGSHGQGATFLKAFLTTIGQEDHQTTSCKITRESLTETIESATRRIDITVELDNFAVGIENKPWAQIGKNQLEDYLSHLKNKYQDNFRLVYLPGNNGEPDVLVDKEKLITYPYHTGFLAWLQDCHKECRSDRFRWFIKDFMEYVEMEFSNN